MRAVPEAAGLHLMAGLNQVGHQPKYGCERPAAKKHNDGMQTLHGVDEACRIHRRYTLTEQQNEIRKILAAVAATRRSPTAMQVAAVA